MMLTLEISMYPLQADYRPLISDFIARLNSNYPQLRINTTITATTVVGEYDGVMQMLSDMLRWSNATHGRAVFVTKFIPDYDPA